MKTYIVVLVRRAGGYSEAEMIQSGKGKKRFFAFQIWFWHRAKMLLKYYSKKEITS